MSSGGRLNRSFGRSFLTICEPPLLIVPARIIAGGSVVVFRKSASSRVKIDPRCSLASRGGFAPQVDMLFADQRIAGVLEMVSGHAIGFENRFLMRGVRRSFAAECDAQP
jgi:hypothetical protein